MFQIQYKKSFFQKRFCTNQSVIPKSCHMAVFFIMVIAICKVCFATFGPVSLYTPAMDETNVKIIPLFSWGSADSAFSFKVQVSKDQYFTNNIILQGFNLTNTSWTATSELPNSTKLYWRVVDYFSSTNDDTQKHAVSFVYSFTTVAGKPATPVLTFPSNGATNINRSPALSWDASTGATNYYYQISTISTELTDSYTQRKVALTNAPFVGLAQNKKYYWRVRAENAAGTSAWSSVMNFTTTTTTTTNTTYDPTVAVQYAKFYSEDEPRTQGPIYGGRTYNPIYYSYSAFIIDGQPGTCTYFTTNNSYCGGDCTNFISQCLIAGNLTFPTNLTDAKGCITGVKALNDWIHDTYNKSPRNLFEEGPYTSTLPVNFLLTPGDVITLSSSTSTYEHTVIVTKVTDAKSASGIFVTAHDMDREDRALSFYFANSYPVARYHCLNPTTIGVDDKVTITSGPSFYSSYPGGQGTYKSLFSHKNSTTKVNSYDWRIEFYYLNGTYVLTSQTIQSNPSDPDHCTYSPTIGTLSNTYDWTRDANGYVTGSCVVKCIDSDGYPHSYAYPITYAVPGRPATPQLSLPANSVTEIIQNPSLQWAAVSGATSYQLQIDRNSTFVAPFIDIAALTATTYITPLLLPNTTYYWRVNAKNSWGTSSFSSVRTFTTKVYPTDIVLVNQQITQSYTLPLIKAHNSITVLNSAVYGGVTASLNAGVCVDIGDGVTIGDGNITNIAVDPALK